MEAIILLADAAQVADNKLYILGGGWTITGPAPAPSAVAIKLSVSPTEFLTTHRWRLALEDQDGRPVLWSNMGTSTPIVVEGELIVTAPSPEDPPGANANIPLAVTFGPLELAPGSRYLWRLTIDGETPQGGLAAFGTRPVQVS